MSELEKLREENQFYRALLQEVSTHLIDVDENEWFCLVCGERAPMSVSNENFPHKNTCPLHKS